MKNIFSLMFWIFIFISCQKTEIIEVDLPYVEYTVIYGEIPLVLGFQGVSITKTLPLNSVYQIEQGEITNAIAYLKMNNLEIIPMTYSGDGRYLPYNTIYPESGQYYELFIDIEGENFYSKTVIPHPPVTRKVEVNNKVINIEVIGKVDESYGALWAYVNVYGQIISQADDFHSIVDSRGSNHIVEIRTKTIPDNIYDSHNISQLHIILYAFGKNFGNYYNSRSQTSSIDNALTQGGAPIYTNISGNNVIGAFTGSAKSIINITVFN